MNSNRQTCKQAAFISGMILIILLFAACNQVTEPPPAATETSPIPAETVTPEPPFPEEAIDTERSRNRNHE